MPAPDRFAQWMSAHEHVDQRLRHVYRYHPRSDAHSIALCTEILNDLVQVCPVLRSQAERGEIVFGINVKFRWPSTGKRKTLDLALGPAADLPPLHPLANPLGKASSLMPSPPARLKQL